MILGVKPGEALKPLLGFQTFLATRLLPLPDGNIRRVNKEVIFYTNLTRLNQPGDIIEEWKNPYTSETVKVVHAINDPFNYTISDMLILAPEDFPGDRSKLPKIPLIFPWQKLDDETLVLSTDMHLNYPNPLQPDKWPRESSGPKAQVSEMMRYFVSIKDLENPKLSAVPYHGTWHRITPWLPVHADGPDARTLHVHLDDGRLRLRRQAPAARARLCPEELPAHAERAHRGLRPESLQPRALLTPADAGAGQINRPGTFVGTFVSQGCRSGHRSGTCIKRSRQAWITSKASPR